MVNRNAKILFLDRDGVLNKELGDYVTRPEELEINAGALNFLLAAISLQYKLVIITNQGGIAKGLYSKQMLLLIHKKLRDLWADKGVHFDAIYFCPHHPQFGKCLCRKPDSLLIEKALHRFSGTSINALFIGDKMRDIEAAQKVGIKGVLVTENSSLDAFISLL
jgi:D-glycero-D-manno-heptose 1,7-bisphosphate phosphatase